MAEQLLVDYSDEAPDTVGQELVNDMSLDKLIIPPDCIQFSFHGLSRPLTPASARFVIGTSVATPAELIAQHGPTEQFSWYAKQGVQNLAVIPLHGDSTRRVTYLPVYPEYDKVIDRQTRAVLWPKPVAS